MLKLLIPLLLVAAAGCTATSSTPEKNVNASAAPLKFVIAIHGGAGTIPENAPPAVQERYRHSLSVALAVGRDELARGGTALDAVEKTVRVLEDDELFNAGKGAVYNELGKHELDASIMDGSTLKCGAVASVRTVKNPISLARLVMTKTNHVVLISDGAEKFADLQPSIERVPNTYFDTEARFKRLQEALEERRKKEEKVNAYKGTVGAVALDSHGNLAAATSTGGLTAKRWGRVGDTPIIGAGNYANKFVAVSCTGTGEEYIRHNVAGRLAALVELKGLTLEDAGKELIFKTLKPDDGGLIAVSGKGEVTTPYNTEGMYRGTADSTGKFDVKIFKDK